MPAFIRRSGAWSEVSKIYVRRNGIWDDAVRGYVYNNGGWVRFFPRPLPPSGISVTAEDTTADALQQIVITAQLIDVNGDNVRESRAVSWSVSGGGLLFNQQTSTNSAGIATATFLAPNFNATSTITVSSTGLTSGSVVITTTLPQLPAPSLTATSNNFGFDVVNNNYDSNNTYSLSFTGGGFGVSQWSGDPNSSFFGMYVPPRIDSDPVASSNGSQVSCTQGSWTVNPQVTITLTVSRSGYTSNSTQLTASPSGSASTSYMWYYYDGATRIQWGPQNPKNIGSLVAGKYVDCDVTRQRGTGAITVARSNKIGPL